MSSTSTTTHQGLSTTPIYPYAQGQKEKIQFITSRGQLFLSLTESVVQLVTRVNKGQRALMSAHGHFSKKMTAFLKAGSDDLDPLESKLKLYSDMYLETSTIKAQNSNEFLKSLLVKRKEIQTAVKNFKAQSDKKWKHITLLRQKVTQEVEALNPSKKSKKSINMDPWLHSRLLSFDYSQLLKAENLFQSEMRILIQQMVDLDSKLMADLDTLSTRYAPPGAPPVSASPSVTAPSPTTAAASPSTTAANTNATTSSSKATPVKHTKFNVLDETFWNVDREANPPFALPSLNEYKELKRGILKRGKKGSKKQGLYIITDTGFLHCFKIKPFGNEKKKLAMAQDDSLVNLVKHDDKDIGFERKQPFFSLPVKDLTLKSIQETWIQIQAQQKGGCGLMKTVVYSIGFVTLSDMKDWTTALNLSVFGEEVKEDQTLSSPTQPIDKGQEPSTEAPPKNKEEKTSPSAGATSESAHAKEESQKDDNSTTVKKDDKKDTAEIGSS